MTAANAMTLLPNVAPMPWSRPARTPGHGKPTAGAIARNAALRASKYLGRALWRRWSGSPRRSRVVIWAGPENDPVDRFPGDWMRCVKRLGQRLMARDFDRQVAEFQVHVAVLKGYTAPGIPVTKVAR
jgi:hypothetical protein